MCRRVTLEIMMNKLEKLVDYLRTLNKITDYLYEMNVRADIKIEELAQDILDLMEVDVNE